MKIKVAAYCRVSTDLEEQENSFENQLKVFRDRIAREPNWEYADIYADPGLSGTTDNRPEFQRMLEDARKHRFDLLLCKSISRFARNTLIAVQNVRHLQSLGIGVIFEKERIDTTKPYSEMLLTVLSAFAQEESRNTSERIKRSNQMRNSRGEVAWSPLYGYTREDGKEYVIVEDQAKVVRRIYEAYNNCEKLADIAEQLNRDRIPSPGGTIWSANTVGSILKNERYAGNVLTGKTFIENYIDHKAKKNRGNVEQFLITDHHEGIVSKEFFETVQEAREMRKNMTYPYGDFLVCPDCGRKLKRISRGWGCTCGEFYLPVSRLDDAMLKAYGMLDHEIKEEHPVMKSVEYWWMKKLVDHIAFDRDGRQMTVFWKNGLSAEVSTGYTRMWGDLKRYKAKEAKKKNKAAKKMKPSVTRLNGKE